jgi:transposase
MLGDKEHTVLRLPSYYLNLNPIELIWADIKQFVASKNTTIKIKDVEQLCCQKFKKIGQEEWANVEELEELC